MTLPLLKSDVYSHINSVFNGVFDTALLNMSYAAKSKLFNETVKIFLLELYYIRGQETCDSYISRSIKEEALHNRPRRQRNH